EAWLATVFARNAQTLVQPQRLLSDGELRWNSIDDEALARRVETLLHRAPDAAAEVNTVEVDGAAFDVLLESVQPVHALTVVGVNEGALALAKLAVGLGWRTTLVDPRTPSPAAPPA